MSDTEKKRWSRKKKITVITLSVICALIVLIVAGGVAALNWYCKTGEYTVTPTTKQVTLVGHRGLRSVAPENTLPAFEEAGKSGFWGAECDIYCSEDGVWVVSHDPNVYRMTGKVKNIEKMTLDEVLDIKINNGTNIENYPELTSCSFEDYIKVCKQYNMVAVIELKGKHNTDQYNKVIDIVEQYGVEAVYISFHFENLQKLRELTDAPVYYLVQEIKPEDIELAKSIENCGIDFNGNKEKNFETDIIKQCQDEGLAMGAWTINDPAVMDKLIEYGVTLITTDQIVYDK